jgi:methionyl-tRNA formyltransferase
MGSPQVALPVLRVLVESPLCDVAGVFAQPDRPVGRGRRMQPCPVAEEARAQGLPVHTPEKAGTPETLAVLREAEPDLLVVCAYGQILPASVLELPRRGSFNLHFSLLPRWRGASPVQAAILAGDGTTGVSLQKMVLELDAGPVVAETAPMPILPDDTGASLAERLSGAAADLLRDALPGLLEGDFSLKEQDAAQATFCRTIRKEAGRIDWEGATAGEIERKVRAYTPWPGCYSFLGDLRLGIGALQVVPQQDADAERHPPGTFLKEGIVPAAQGWVRLVEVKPAGKGGMPLQAFLNGAPWAVGKRLTPEPQPASK